LRMRSILPSDGNAFAKACSKTFTGSDYFNNFGLSGTEIKTDIYEKDNLCFRRTGDCTDADAGTEKQQTGRSQT